MAKKAAVEAAHPALRPLDDRVVVEPLEAEEKTAGGILLPDTAKQKPQQGKVIAVGPGKLSDEGNRLALAVKVGDIVRRNQHIADVGQTGHATGPHLHFEVHVKGVPQNPVKFLDAGGAANQVAIARVEPPR